jgi:hypothetical protein
MDNHSRLTIYLSLFYSSIDFSNEPGVCHYDQKKHGTFKDPVLVRKTCCGDVKVFSRKQNRCLPSESSEKNRA